MFSQFFGQYLLKRNYLSAGQLRFVMSLQDFAKVKLGIVAIDEGLMTAEQVETVHAMQARVDKRFGELAIEGGYLDAAQVDVLLSRQNTRHLSLSQTLVDEEIMSFETVERVLAEYKAECGLSEYEFEALRSEDSDTLAETLGDMPGLDGSHLRTGYMSLFVRNLIRFVDENIVMERAEQVGERPFECLVLQEMQGKHGGYTGLAGPQRSASGFAARYAKLDEADLELTADGLGEFLNVQNGLFLSKLSNDWVEMELGVPQFRQKGTLRPNGALYAVPFVLPFGRFDLLVGLGEPTFG
jgi:hypothetical protein